jgi:hypothetical protein
MWAANKGWAQLACQPPRDGASWTTNQKNYNGAPHYENEGSNNEEEFNQNDTYTSKKNKAQQTWCYTYDHKRHTSGKLPKYWNAGSKETLDESTHTDNRPNNKFHAWAFNYTSLSSP